MGKALLYYISGHGFGHARRCAETLRVVAQRHPDLPIHVRTMADAGVLEEISANLHYQRVLIDRGAVENDAVTIDWDATIRSVRDLIATKDQLVAEETKYIRERDIGLIIADVPFMAGYVGEAAGVPCWAQSNFFWDWIYEARTDDQQLLDTVRGGYRRCTGALRLPLPHPTGNFRRVIDTPFICSPLSMPKDEARRRLGIGPEEHRPIVFVAMRGGTSPEIIAKLAGLEREYLFVASGVERSRNMICWAGDMRFWDVLQVCDVVVSKPGHGVVTDCAVMGIALLHPPRNGFREDAVTIGEGSRYFRERQIPMADYTSGNWKPPLDALLSQPKPPTATNTNGREFVADFIAHELGL